MIPEPSKLNWSDKKPTFEEVQGKIIAVNHHAYFRDYIGMVVMNKSIYDDIFGDGFIRYAIIDVTQPDPEPLPLWGVMPEIVETVTFNPNTWYASFDCHKGDDTFSISTFGYPTRSEAINEWNKLAEALEKLNV